MAVYQGRYLKLATIRGTRVTNMIPGVPISVGLTVGARPTPNRTGVVVHADATPGGTGATGTAPRQEPLEIAWKRSMFE